MKSIFYLDAYSLYLLGKIITQFFFFPHKREASYYHTQFHIVLLIMCIFHIIMLVFSSQLQFCVLTNRYSRFQEIY
jgi:hypothetical protein